VYTGSLTCAARHEYADEDRHAGRLLGKTIPKRPRAQPASGGQRGWRGWKTNINSTHITNLTEGATTPKYTATKLSPRTGRAPNTAQVGQRPPDLVVPYQGKERDALLLRPLGESPVAHGFHHRHRTPGKRSSRSRKAPRRPPARPFTPHRYRLRFRVDDEWSLERRTTSAPAADTTSASSPSATRRARSLPTRT